MAGDTVSEIGIAVNPAAGGGRALRVARAAEEELRKLGVKCRMEMSSSPDDLARLGPRFRERGIRRIVIAGGDGTLNVVLNGISQDVPGGDIEIGILPSGTANDFAHALGLPHDIEEAARVAAGGTLRRVDVCRLNGRLFLNASGIGLDAAVARASRRYAPVFGRLAYVVAAAARVCRRPAWRVRVRWDGGEYAGPMTLMTIGNGNRTGGCYYLTPRADPADGRLDLLIHHASPALRIVLDFPSMMRRGHGEFRQSISACSAGIEVASDLPLPVHIDGELFETGDTVLRYEILPGALAVAAVPSAPGGSQSLTVTGSGRDSQ